MLKEQITVHKLARMPYAQAKVNMAEYSNGDRTLSLISYTTQVVGVLEFPNQGTKIFSCSGLYSQTTRKHISAFMNEYFPELGYTFIRDVCVGKTIKIDSLGNVSNFETGEYYGVI